MAKKRSKRSPVASGLEVSAKSADKVLADTDIEEALSRVYAQAVAAVAGYSVATPDFDRDGVDLIISAGGQMRPSIALQLKATINIGGVVDGNYRYSLKRRNYDLLRMEAQTPRLLFLLSLHKEQKSWLSLSPEELVLRHCAYWVNLVGAPETENETAVTIDVPAKNQFDVEALKMLMDQSRTGSIS